ncbi:transposase-like protein [Novosphingobium chloroacetimidivorans]|uniref:Mutator family transposase n=1 Tax=Novosphingobium chloroacetimidivorans TaxID=1428314 RepID=A0A7W7KDT1_9SPHN|nr:transposase-like protein [Novosphingobium chloroacetimidivorans]
MSGISTSSVSKLCEDINERVNAFLKRPLAGDWPYFWLDATYLKVREGGRIVSVAAMIAVAVTTEGKREIVSLHIGPSEAEPFWTTFLKDLVWRGLKGGRRVISDAQEGLKTAITRVAGATWQRCRVHFMRNALAYVPKGQNTRSPRQSGRSSGNPITPPPTRPGAMSPTNCAPAGRNSAPAWTTPSTTSLPT